MNKYYEQAKKLQAKMIEQRRELHQMPELGLDLPKTSAYVEEKLKALGLEVKKYGTSGLSATIKGGKGEGKTILLRADMDALPMEEINDLDFKAEAPVLIHAATTYTHPCFWQQPRLLTTTRTTSRAMLNLCSNLQKKFSRAHG